MIHAVINGVDYGPDKITECKTYAQLFSSETLSFGGAVSRQLDLSLIEPGEIPRGAKIELYSDQTPQGIFFVDTRETDDNNVLTLHAYDTMLKFEQTYIKEGDTGEWPRSMTTVLTDIASKVGVELDPRNVIVDYNVEFPNDYTMREILCYIAAANAGNWTITKSGLLYLAGIVLPEETNYLIDQSGNAIMFGEVRILV